MNSLVAWHNRTQGLGTARKLNAKWKGPFKVAESKSPLFRIKGKNGNYRWIHKNHLKLWFGTSELLDCIRSRGRPIKVEGKV